MILLLVTMNYFPSDQNFRDFSNFVD